MRRAVGRGLLTAALVSLILLGVGGCGSGGEETSDQSATVEKVEQGALQEYQWRMERKAALLLEWTTQLWGQLVAGEAGKAQSRYATSRVQYGQLLPAAHLFPELDQRINGQAGEGEPFTGFHRIERPLFERETTAGLKGFGKALVEDVKHLRHEFKMMELEPTELAEAAVELVKEISAKKLAGKEEPYADLDLVDVSASAEGAEEAFRALRPLLASRDPELVLEIEATFLDLYEALAEFGSPGRQPQERDPAAGAIFVGFDGLSKNDLAETAKSLHRLEGLFRQVPERVSGG